MSRLISPSCLYISETGAWCSDDANDAQSPRVGDIIKHRVSKTFFDVWLFYANLIDYTRILMTLVALALIFLNNNANKSFTIECSIGALIFGSVLLDAVDGHAARYFHQSTVMGCGWDWLADIFAQYCLAVWSITSAPNSLITIFVVFFSLVEIACGLFDFAISAQSVYPSMRDTSVLPWYARVEHWLAPNHTYNLLGWMCWLANSSFPIGVCLGWQNEFACILMAPFALLYAWHECVQLVFVVVNWKETVPTLNQQGIEVMRECNKIETNMLQNVYDETKKLHKQNDNEKEICWFNLYLQGEYSDKFTVMSTIKDEFAAWVESLIKEFYPYEVRNIISYGFIHSPKNASRDQPWHLDYGHQVSNLFIPLNELTIHNSTQFIRGPLSSKTVMPESNNFAGPNELMRDEGKKWLEVCQIVCKPFMILKMYSSVVHRGRANSGNYDRVLFFVSTSSSLMKNEDIGENFYYNKVDS